MVKSLNDARRPLGHQFYGHPLFSLFDNILDRAAGGQRNLITGDVRFQQGTSPNARIQDNGAMPLLCDPLFYESVFQSLSI